MSDLRPGDPDHIGPYRLTGFLGEGGQGIVYQGVTEHGRPVAIKVLHTRLADDEKARARFLRELQSARAVARFCTAQVLDAAVEGSSPYIVSEFVDGPSLRQVVKKQGPRDEGTIERLAIGTATALSAIHLAGIVHRDLNPSNVLLGPDGPRVVDFGISKALESALESTERLGTPAYMAPEQFMTPEIGPAGDIFSWAGTILFAATGQPPFGKGSLGVIMNRILTSEPDLSSLPETLQPSVALAFAKDPAERPDADGLLRALLGQEDVPAPQTLVLPREHSPRPSRRKILLGAGAGVLSLGTAGGAAAMAYRGRERPPPFAADLVGELAGHHRGASSLVVGDLKGKPILVSGGGRENRVRVFDLQASKELPYTFKHKDYVVPVAFAQAGGRPIAVSGGGDERVRLWDLSSGRSMGSLRGGSSIEDLTFAKVDGRDVVAFSDGMGVQIHDLRTRKKVRTLQGAPPWIFSLTTGEAGGLPVFLAGCKDGQVWLWDAATGSLIDTLGTHDQQVNAVAYGASGRRPLVLSGSEDGSVFLWDLVTRQQLDQLPAHPVKINDLAFGETGNRVFAASCGEDGMVQVTDTGTYKPLCEPFLAHKEGAGSITAFNDRLLTGGKTGGIKIWRLRPI